MRTFILYAVAVWFGGWFLYGAWHLIGGIVVPLIR